MQNFLLFLLCRLTDLYYICWKESFNKEIMQLIDGKAISEQVKQEIAAEVAEIVAKGGKRPHLQLSSSAMTEEVKHTWQPR